MKIYVGSIVGRYYEYDHVASLLRLLRVPNVTYAPRVGDALLCRARSKVATDFLATDADVLLTIDSDIVFQPEDALTVCHMALDKSAVVGGQYVTRVKGGPRCFPTSLVEDDLTVTYGPLHETVPAKYVAGGFTAIPRVVLEKMAQRSDCPMLHEKSSINFRPFYQPMIVDGDGEQLYLSEDWAFCERARQEGFPILLDPGVRLLHIGPHFFRLEDMLEDQLATQQLSLTRHAGGRYDRDTPGELVRG